MNIKIQGGGNKKYANVGSCYGIVAYLQHEDAERAMRGDAVEPFFDQTGSARFSDVTARIDENVAKLCRSDAKFFVITVSPSKKEIEAMGATEQERTATFKRYIQEDIMRLYAAGFNKGLTKDDVLYFAKIHHSRNDNDNGQMHAHIIVSRKDKSNRVKLSPNTNHRGDKPTGTVKGGFDRSLFFLQGEQAFDARYAYQRPTEETFAYCNAMKNGTIEEKRTAIAQSAWQERQQPATNTLPEKEENRAIPIQSENFEGSIGASIVGLLGALAIDIPPAPPAATAPDIPSEEKKKKKKKRRRWMSL
jgi:hypothetical protein